MSSEITEKELRRIVQQEVMKILTPEPLPETGGIPLLLRRIEELRGQAHERIGWQPGMLLRHRSMRTQQLFNNIKANIPQQTESARLFPEQTQPRRILDFFLAPRKAPQPPPEQPLPPPQPEETKPRKSNIRSYG